jgi:hypothetical protein
MGRSGGPQIGSLGLCELDEIEAWPTPAADQGAQFEVKWRFSRRLETYNDLREIRALTRIARGSRAGPLNPSHRRARAPEILLYEHVIFEALLHLL